MYKVKDLEHLVLHSDAETKKRFDMVKRLSHDFTVANATAQQMDELLAEQLEAANDETPGPSNPTTKKKPASRPKKGGDSGIEEKFEELFEALKDYAGPTSAAPNEQAVRAMVKEAMSGQKIGLSNLAEDIRELLSQKPQVIKYDLPKVQTMAFKKPEIDTFQMIVDDVMMGNNVFLVGGAGTGKTYLGENLVAKMALGRKHLTINCSQWTTPTEIVGGQTMDGYVEGKLIEAWQNGYVLILDELPKIDPNTAGLFNDALAKTNTPNAVIFNSRRESFTKHDNFACIANGNIYPDKESMVYGANNKQDLSLLDRFSGSVYYIEKNPSIEKEIIQNKMVWSVCDRMRSAVEELKYEAQLSLRFMRNARDAYNLEMQRLKSKSGIKANDGKTFKSAVDSYLSTFTDIQRKNLKDKIRYGDLMSNYDYREFDITKTVF